MNARNAMGRSTSSSWPEIMQPPYRNVTNAQSQEIVLHVMAITASRVKAPLNRQATVVATPGLPPVEPIAAQGN
jgi:hypothetical protein